MDTNDMDETTWNALVDSQLVIDYMARAGLLRPDDRLVDEVHNIRAGIERREVPHVGILLQQLSEALNRIAEYTSLVELRAGYSPFSWCYTILRPSATPQRVIDRFIRMKVMVTKMLPFLFLIASVISAGYLLDRYRTDLVLLKSIEYIESVDPDKIINEIVRQVKDSNGDVKGLMAFENSMESLARAKKEVDIVTTFEYEHNAGKGKLLEAVFSGPLRLTTSGAGSAGTAEPAYVVAWKKNAGLTQVEPVEVKSLKQSDNTRARCDDLARKLKQSAGPMKASLNKDYSLCIEHALSLSGDRARFDAVTSRSGVIRRDAYKLAAWYIPLAVGFLGASIYLLYIRDHRRPFFSFQRTCLRFALGGVAGVVVAWVYPPAQIATADLNVMDSMRQFPFLFAFLAGFAADGFFRFLSRKVEELGQGQGTTNPPSPALPEGQGRQ